MTNKDAVTVVVRVTAVWLTFRLLQAAAQIGALAGKGQRPSIVVITILCLVVLAAITLSLLWVNATRIAGFLLPRETSPDETMQLSAQDFKALAFSVVGMYLVATAIPSVGYWVAFVRRSTKVNPDGFNPPIDMYATIVQVVVQVVVGLYLVLGSRGLAAMVRRLRGTP